MLAERYANPGLGVTGARPPGLLPSGEDAIAFGPRPRVVGKSLFGGAEKIFVRGVTYGTFRGSGESPFPAPEIVEADFSAMAAVGVNAVRTYVAPPPWLLDMAADRGLRILVGLPWEQHVTFLDDRSRARSIAQRIRSDAAPCAGHPALLGFAVGNEIPSSIVRWHGARRVASFLERVYSEVKDLDPEALVTYVNYPSSEYLELPFLDVVAFNVYLDNSRRLVDYLPRLQNVAGERPLMLTELGLDSQRHGEDAQAAVLEDQLHSAFDAGCAGTFVFAWTDEWHRNGHEVEDWAFGVTDRRRRPKPSLFALRRVYTNGSIGGREGDWPTVSVVICTHNGSRTLADCLAGVAALDYPHYECIVVDDGSTDATAEIARSFGVTLIHTEKAGLATARNLGCLAASGAIVAYIDDDTVPDPQWLRYLASAFRESGHAAIGGPNLSPPPRGLVEDCVGRSPGNPIHVLLTDDEAEHIPGCNMAFRKEALEELGGFDPRFEVAGDDVDICWRVRERGWTLGYHAAAVVWHRRRESFRAFLKQQIGYGRAEGLLARKWPEKYNRRGHARWEGHVYAGRRRESHARRWQIYYGVWGTAPFQRRTGTHGRLSGLAPTTPDTFLLLAVLGLWSAYDFLDRPLLLRVPLVGVPIAFLAFLAVLAGLVVAGCRHGWSVVGCREPFVLRRLTMRVVTAALYVLQPLARLVGRVSGGLSLWRIRAGAGYALPRLHTLHEWSEQWLAGEERIAAIERRLLFRGIVVARGSEFDRWDLEAHAGALGAARLRVVVEEHGDGCQLVRYRIAPRLSGLAVAVLAGLGGLTAYSLAGSLTGGVALGLLVVLVGAKAAADCTASTAHALSAVRDRDTRVGLAGRADWTSYPSEPALMLAGVADGGE